MQKLYILSFVSLSLFSCGTTQLADDSDPKDEPSMESNTEADQQLKVIEVVPGKLENPGSIKGRTNGENPEGERPK